MPQIRKYLLFTAKYRIGQLQRIKRYQGVAITDTRWQQNIHTNDFKREDRF